MKKNDICEITIEDIGNDGEGIGHIADAGSNCGITVFVKDTVVGDVAKIKLVKIKKNYAYGRLEEIIKPSPVRVEPICENARRCGGCALMHMSYEKQLDYKWNKVRNCLERIGGLADAASVMEPVCGMDNPYNYRNKMQFPVGLSKDGVVQIGFYAGRTHNIIDLDCCHIGHPVNNFLIKYLRSWLQKWQDKSGKFIYDEEKHRGVVRHILTRVGFATGELMVCIVVNSDSLNIFDKGNPKKENGSLSELEKELKDAIEQAVTMYNMNQSYASKDYYTEIKFTGLSININKEKTNRILGDRCVTLYGQDYISDFIGDIKFNISPLSFYQVNPIQTKVLYDKAVDFAGLTGNEIVWDMYCGIGTISLCLAKKAKKVYGVEIVPQAIEDAKMNAMINGITNVEFFCGKAEEVVPGFYAGELNCDGLKSDMRDGCHPDVVVVDPPRKGCDSVLLDTIDEMSPKRLVYVSCDPATLARDVKILAEKGFVAEKVAVVDQFGHSGHVETVVKLVRKKA